MSIHSLFRYYGNKGRMLKYYRPIPLNTKRIVEPYLGSGVFVLNHNLPGLGFEINADVVAMWQWLQTTSPEELKDLYEKVESIKKQQTKPDVRLLNLALGPQTYVRVNVTGVIVGQLSSWGIYPQFRLPIEKTIKALERCRQVRVEHKDAEAYKDMAQEGDFLFIDPPYINTFANYKQGAKVGIEEAYQPEQTVRLIASTQCPVMLVYGDGAEEVFPMYE